jgi:hypothetical protein
MRIACRWPGGITLALPRKSGNHVTFFIAGPPGEPSIVPDLNNGKPPSRNVATDAHKRVADTVRRMIDTVGSDYAPHEYGVTDVPGDFWNEWLRQNAGFDIVTQEMVFALE